MNLSRSQKLRLGVFVAAGLTLATGTIATLAGLKIFERRDIYTARFTENVGGLEVSAPVKYRGLRVGRVDDMQIATDDPGAIEVTLSLVAGTDLYEGTRAALDASGLTGLKSINLKGGGDPSKGKIPPGSELPSDPGFMDALVDRAENVALRVSEVADQVARWTSDANRERFESLLVSTDSFVRNADRFLAEHGDSMGTAVDSVARAGDGIAKVTVSAASTLNAVQGDIAAITRAIRRPLERLDPDDLQRTLSATRSAMETLAMRLADGETGAAITNLSTTLERMSRLLDDLDLAVRASREDFTASLSYLRQAAEDLREFSRIIAQDPSTLVRGRGN